MRMEANSEVVGTFEEARRKLNSALPVEDGPRRRSRRRPAEVVEIVNWKEVIDEYKRESELKGLSLENITAIWKVISGKSTGIGVVDRAALALCMIPEKQIPEKLVDEMISWVVRTFVRVNQCNKIAMNMLMYFIGLVEYELVDGNPFAEIYNYNSMVILLRQHDVTIPLVCHLLKFVTTVEHVTSFLVSSLNTFRVRDLQKVHARAIDDLLRLYKALRPEMFSKNSLKLKVIGAGRVFQLEESFMRRLYEAQRRHTGRVGVDECSPSRRSRRRSSTTFDRTNPWELLKAVESTTDIFFPEFKPSSLVHRYGNANIGDLKPRDRMYNFLLREERLCMLAFEPASLRYFYGWVSMIFRHKFNNYDVKQDHRYKFILGRCLFLTQMINESLAPVDDWLPEYLMNWDGLLFRKEIIGLLKYMSILDFQGEYHCILDKFERWFIDGELSERVEIWEVFTTLYSRWAKAIDEDEDGIVSDESELSRSPIDVLKTMHDFLCHLISVYAAADGTGENFLLFIMCGSFSSFMDKFSNSSGVFVPFPGDALWYMILATDSLQLLECYCDLSLKLNGMNGHCTNSKATAKQSDAFVDCFSMDAPMRHLFKGEHRFLKLNPARPEDDEDTETQMNNAINYNCLKWPCLQHFLVRENRQPGAPFDMAKMEKESLNVFKVVKEAMRRDLKKGIVWP